MGGFPRIVRRASPYLADRFEHPQGIFKPLK
jgi:hypothetical protein